MVTAGTILAEEEKARSLLQLSGSVSAHTVLRVAPTRVPKSFVYLRVIAMPWCSSKVVVVRVRGLIILIAVSVLFEAEHRSVPEYFLWRLAVEGAPPPCQEAGAHAAAPSLATVRRHRQEPCRGGGPKPY